MFRTTVGVLTLSLTSLAAAQQTLEVPAAFATIQAAVDAVSAGDTIEVSSGTYAPFAAVGLTDVEIVAKGKVVVAGDDSGDPAVALTGCAGVTLSKFTVEGGVGHGVVIDGSTDVTVDDFTVSGVGGDGIRVTSSSGGLLDKPNIEGVGGTGVVLGVTGLEADEVVLEVAKITEPGGDGISIVGTANLVEKCKLFEVAGVGIRVSGTGNRLCRNTVKGALDVGFVLTASSEAVLERNSALDTQGGLVIDGLANEVDTMKIVSPNGVAVAVSGLQNRLTRAKITKGTGKGVTVTGNNHRIARTKVIAVLGDAFGIAAVNCTLEENVAIKALNDGFDVAVTTTGTDFVKNRASKSGDSGFEVYGEGNLFERNVAKGNASFDLIEIVSDESANTYVKNKFKVTTSISAD